MIVTIKDMRRAKYCMPGCRKFFQKHGFDWNDFRKNGIDAQLLLDTGDAMAINLVEMTHGWRG